MSKLLEYRCIVPSCDSVNVQSIRNEVKVFPLPKVLSMRNKWLSSIPGVTKRLKSTSGVCSLHFYLRDLNGKDELHPESIPHLPKEPPEETEIKSLSDLADQLEMNPEVIPSKIQHLITQGEYIFYKIEFLSKGTPEVEYSVHIYSDLSYDVFHRSSPKRMRVKGIVFRALEEIRDVLEELDSIHKPSHTKDRIGQALDLLSEELEDVPFSVSRKLEFIIDQLRNVGIKSRNMVFTDKSMASFKELQVMPASLYKLLGCNLALPDMSEHGDLSIKELKDFCQTYVENAEFRKSNQLKEDLLSRIFENASPVTDVVGKTLNKLWSGHIDDYRTDLCLTSFLLLNEIYTNYQENNTKDPLVTMGEAETSNEVVIKEEEEEEGFEEASSPENIIVESDETFLFPFNEKVKAVYSCCFCPVKLSNMEETLSHCGDEHPGFDVVVKIKPGPIVTIKSSLNELSCVDCKTEHVTSEEMVSHVNYHTYLVHAESRSNNKKILRQTCSICKVGFIDKFRLRSHYASAHPDSSIFECKKCSQIFHKCSEYLKHKLYSHKKRPINPARLYDCELCEKKFREKSLLDRHYARDHQHRKYVCDVCEKEFDMQRYLTKHKARVHPESFDYVCEFCGKKFAINEYLNSHKKICKFRSSKLVTEESEFQCSKCGKCFTNEIFLLNHRAMVHDKKRKENHCVTCDKYFVNAISLRHHMTTHDENRPKYSCNFCDKEYLSKSTLQFHILSHHSEKAPEKTFKCDYCDWSFWENKSLRNHVKLVHDKVRDHKCDICNRAFGCKRHLLRHKTTIHDKFREYKCHLCSVEYFQKISLKNHLKKIHLVTDYMPPKQTKD